MRIRAFSLADPVRNACAPYCDIICGHIFRHYLINGAIFGKKVTKHKMSVLIFYTTLVYNLSYSEKNLARVRQKCRKLFR